MHQAIQAAEQEVKSLLLRCNTLEARLARAERYLRVIADNPGWRDHAARAQGYFDLVNTAGGVKEPDVQKTDR